MESVGYETGTRGILRAALPPDVLSVAGASDLPACWGRPSGSV